jgi:hypothetical protein
MKVSPFLFISFWSEAKLASNASNGGPAFHLRVEQTLAVVSLVVCHLCASRFSPSRPAAGSQTHHMYSRLFARLVHPENLLQKKTTVLVFFFVKEKKNSKPFANEDPAQWRLRFLLSGTG